MTQRASRLRTIAAAGFVVITSADAAAGPPLTTDDPDTPGPGNWEINIANELEKAGGEWAHTAPLLDINYGVGERIQLKYAAPYLIVDRPGQDALSGVGNSELGVKWRFADENTHGLSASVYPQVAFNSSRTAWRRGIVERGAEFLLPFQAKKTFGPLLIYAEAGFTWLEHRRDEWIYGVAAEYALTGTLELVGEIHGVAASGFDAHELVLNGGCKWHFHEHIALLAAAGHSVRMPAGEPGVTVGYLGFQLTFQPQP